MKANNYKVLGDETKKILTSVKKAKESLTGFTLVSALCPGQSAETKAILTVNIIALIVRQMHSCEAVTQQVVIRCCIW